MAVDKRGLRSLEKIAVGMSDRGGIDWRSFDIEAGETTRFQQPGSVSVALNRVRGSDPSAIFGNLSANGKIYLVNPNGIVFGPGSRVDVGGLVATTADIDNGDFMAGIDRFGKPSPEDRKSTRLNSSH